MATVSYSATTGVVNFDGFVLTQKNPYYKNKYCKIKKPLNFCFRISKQTRFNRQTLMKLSLKHDVRRVWVLKTLKWLRSQFLVRLLSLQFLVRLLFFNLPKKPGYSKSHLEVNAMSTSFIHIQREDIGICLVKHLPKIQK